MGPSDLQVYFERLRNGMRDHQNRTEVKPKVYENAFEVCVFGKDGQLETDDKDLKGKRNMWKISTDQTVSDKLIQRQEKRKKSFDYNSINISTVVSIYSIFYILFYILYSIFYILYSIFYILYSILYSIFYILLYSF
jgi:hypothetical protein